MKTKNTCTEILKPINQLNLYGYEYYFDNFANLYKNNKLPNTILLSGSKGLGKSTFAYHFINYLLSNNEDHKYSFDNYAINSSNNSYHHLCNNTHTNFFLLENENSEENIKVEKVRNLLRFLNKTTYNSNIKIVLIDNAEFLNVNSSNALLKVLEEPSKNTYFFIIHDSSNMILNTIKSRCVEFKVYLSNDSKKEILRKIIYQHDLNYNLNNINDDFYYATPGNILKYLSIFHDVEINLQKDRMFCIDYLIDKYKKKKDPELLNFISMHIELFYNQLCLENNNNSNLYFYNKMKIIKQFYESKKFHLDMNSFFVSIKKILYNER